MQLAAADYIRRQLPQTKIEDVTSGQSWKTQVPRTNQSELEQKRETGANAVKHAAGAKRGKTGNRCQTRENLQPVPNEGKQATGAKRG